MYILYLSFYGYGVHGWQMQPVVTTFQATLRRAFEKIFKSKDIPNPTGCSRTDVDVHALEFIATMKAVRNIDPDSLCKGLNSFLPRNIRIKKVERVEGFQDARSLVAGKHYRYIIYNDKIITPFLYPLVWQSSYDLNIERMRACIPYIVGTHDFACFRASNTDTKNTIKTIYSMRVERNGNIITIDMVGDGFLKHMVRIITGTMVEVAKRRLEPEGIKKIIEEGSRDFAGETLPGKGLYLFKLFRPGEDISQYVIPDFNPDFMWKL